MSLKYIGEKPDGIEINELLEKVSLSGAAVSTRIRKMHELGLLTRSKRIGARISPRPPYVYCLAPSVTLNAIEAIINTRGIDVERFQVEQEKKRAAITDVFDSDAFNSEPQQPDAWEEPAKEEIEYPHVANSDIDTKRYNPTEQIHTLESPRQNVDKASETRSVNTEFKTDTSTSANEVVSTEESRAYNNTDNSWEQTDNSKNPAFSRDGNSASTFEERIERVLTRMAQEIARQSQEIADLKNRLAKLDKKTLGSLSGSFNEDQILNILEQTQNGKV